MMGSQAADPGHGEQIHPQGDRGEERVGDWVVGSVELTYGQTQGGLLNRR